MLDATQQGFHKTFVGRRMILGRGNQLFAERFGENLHQIFFQAAYIFGRYFPTGIHRRTNWSCLKEKQ